MPLALSEPAAQVETRFTSTLAPLPMTWHLCWPLMSLWLNLARLREWTYSPRPSARTRARRHWGKYFPEDVMERSDEGGWFQKKDEVFPTVVLWGEWNEFHLIHTDEVQATPPQALSIILEPAMG